jgi:hypothetical protein
MAMHYFKSGQSGLPLARSQVRIGQLWRCCTYGLGIIFFLSGYAQAQPKEITQQTITWYRLADRIDFSPAWRLMLEAEYRPFNFAGNCFQYYVRGRVQHQLNEHWRLGLGVAYFRQTNHQPRVKGNLDVPEIRPHQELTYQHTAGKWETIHQVRMEERFFRRIKGSELIDGYRFNFRFRYRLEFTRTLVQPETEVGSLKLRTHGEVMLNAGAPIVYNFLDQVRFYAGLNYQVSRPWSVEVGYMKSFQQRESGYQYWDRDIVRVAIQHQWQVKRP